MTSFKTAIRQLHLWLGLSSGLVVFVVSVTGCLYVFKDELEPLIYASFWEVETTEENPKSLSYLYQQVVDHTGDSLKIQSVQWDSDPKKTIIFSAYEEHRGKALWYWQMDKYYRNYYVNRYTGNVEKDKNMMFEFFYVVFQLHWGLLLAHSIGQPIVGTAVILFVLLLLSGLVLWWPKRAKKKKFLFQWKAATRWRRKNYDLHSIAGFYVLVFAMILAITGLVFAFQWVDHGLQWLVNGGKAIEQTQNSVQILQEKENFSGHHLDSLISYLGEQFPKANNIFISFEEDRQVPNFATVQHNPNFRYKAISFEIDSIGHLFKLPEFSDLNGGQQLKAMNYDIHVGSILGMPGKILAFFASLVSASLPVTGFMIWLGRRRKRKDWKGEIFR